jgi:hypothetical protein
MSRFKRSVLWTALLAIALLVGFSIYGAFLGADRAKAFFNSLPIAVYWWLLAILLATGIVLFQRLIRVPSLLLMHLGCIVVLMGGMWGSVGGHTLQKRLFGIDKIPRGHMLIFEKGQDNRVFIEDMNHPRTLPFTVRLDSCRTEYYPGGLLAIRDREGHFWRLNAEPNATLSLGRGLGRVTVERVYENFKVDIEGDKVVMSDEPDGYNPAVEVRIDKPDGTTTRRRIFEQFPAPGKPQDALDMSYMKMPSRYVSEVEVVRDGAVAASKSIEVNHPLHCGGYYFYQQDLGESRAGPYSVLTVASDSGLNAVYAGYVMLAVGLCWRLWRGRLALVSQRHGQDGRATQEQDALATNQLPV